MTLQPTIIMKNGTPHAWHDGDFHPVLEMPPVARGALTPEPSVAPSREPGVKNKHVGPRENSLAAQIRRYIYTHGQAAGVDRDTMITALTGENLALTPHQVIQASGQLAFKGEISIFPLRCRGKQTYFPTGRVQPKPKKAAGRVTGSVIEAVPEEVVTTTSDPYRDPTKKPKRGAWGDYLRSVMPPNEWREIEALANAYNELHGLTGTIYKIKVKAHVKMMGEDFIVDHHNQLIMYVPNKS